jgi:hypothetical protein
VDGGKWRPDLETLLHYLSRSELMVCTTGVLEKTGVL